MQKRHLAIFDIDGTIAEKGVVPQEVVDGLLHVQKKGYVTTIASGRGYVRAREALGEHFLDVISPDAYMVVEHGTKIMDRDGAVVWADYFKENELDHIVDFTVANQAMVRLLWFISPDVSKPIQIWCKYPEDIPAETEKRGHYGEVFHCSFPELRERLNEFQTSCVTVKLEPYVKVENLKLRFTRSDINVVFQDGNMEFIRNMADKGKAITFMEETLHVSGEDTLIAGNAINDVDMLNLDVETRILVGCGADSEVVMGHLHDAAKVIRLDSPKELGAYLGSL